MLANLWYQGLFLDQMSRFGTQLLPRYHGYQFLPAHQYFVLVLIDKVLKVLYRQMVKEWRRWLLVRLNHWHFLLLHEPVILWQIYEIVSKRPHPGNVLSLDTLHKFICLLLISTSAAPRSRAQYSYSFFLLLLFGLFPF